MSFTAEEPQTRAFINEINRSGNQLVVYDYMTGTDKILEVDGQPVSGENIDEVASKMKGPAGTQVKLKVLKRTTGKTVELELTRANIKRETVSSKILEDNVGYLQITQFGVNTASEFAQHFNNLTDEGMSSLVVDLRNNPGGYMEMAVEIADFFIEEGRIVYTLNKHGEERIYEATKGATEVPMVILANEGSASASEIFVGAMKDYGLAKVVGEETYGKGVTQIPYPLYDGSILKITDSRYYTPSGVCIDKEGIEPDIVVDMDDEDYYSLTEPSTEDDAQLKKAVEVLVK
jgi:carboxyl-terminal processing protease